MGQRSSARARSWRGAALAAGMLASCYDYPEPERALGCELTCFDVCPGDWICTGGLCAPAGETCPVLNYAFDEGCSDEITTLGIATCAPPVLQLTTSSTEVAGAAWINRAFEIPELARFSIEVTLSSLPGDMGSHGDGFAIVLQSDGRGLNALGEPGRYLGYGGPARPITPSVALELDTIRDGLNCPAPHAGFDIDGQVPTTGPPCGVMIAAIDPTSGDPFTVWLDRDAGTLSAYVAADRMAKPATPLLTIVHDLSRLGPSIFIGVTSATGADYGPQQLHEIRIDLDP
jgi:hypothetical protein